MGDSIQIKYGSLKDAVHALGELENELEEKSFSTTLLINESRGAAYDAVNEYYETLQMMETNLKILVGKMKAALEKGGITFVDAENTISGYFANLESGVEMNSDD